MSSTQDLVLENGKIDECLNKSDINISLEKEHQKNHSINNTTKIALKILVITLFYLYFGWATWYFIQNNEYTFSETTCSGYGFLAILYIISTYLLTYNYFLKPCVLPLVKKGVWSPLKNVLSKLRYGSITFYVIFLILVVGYLVYDTKDNRRRLIPVSGLIFILFVAFVLSANKSKIPWHTVIRGFILQFLLGLLIMRWATGRHIVECIGEKIHIFLDYSTFGARFVYGDKLIDEYQVFAFKALAPIFFLGFFINILYYYQIMQKIVGTIGEFLEFVMGTSICESVTSAANIFLGMSESPLLLKPYLPFLTDAEIHSVMTTGFSMVAGTVLAAYISFGADPANLITATVMAAPTALSVAKILYPETEVPKVTKENVTVTNEKYDSVMDAASKGVFDALNIVLGITACLIAFIAMVYFINGVLAWMGNLVGFYGDLTWSLELLVGKIFIPVSYLMGVEWNECEKVAQLVGIKTMVNEFVAFERMGKMDLSERSKTIATFAICGFSNPGSIGITVSTLSILIPHKRDVISRLVFRAFIGGALVCLLTACLAGILMP